MNRSKAAILGLNTRSNTKYAYWSTINGARYHCHYHSKNILLTYLHTTEERRISAGILKHKYATTVRGTLADKRPPAPGFLVGLISRRFI